MSTTSIKRRTLLADALFGDNPIENAQPRTESSDVETLVKHVRRYRASLRWTNTPNMDEIFETKARVVDVEPFAVQLLDSRVRELTGQCTWAIYREPLIVDDDEAPTKLHAYMGDIVNIRARLKEGRNGINLHVKTMKRIQSDLQYTCPTIYTLVSTRIRE